MGTVRVRSPKSRCVTTLGFLYSPSIQASVYEWLDVDLERGVTVLPNAPYCNRQIAGHLGVHETTMRRWRKRKSAPGGADTIRTPVRNGEAYSIDTGKISKNLEPRLRVPMTWERLRQDYRDLE